MMSYMSLVLYVSALLSCGTTRGEDWGNDWWKHVITYQVYPRSFQDSDGDGIGDLKGIESRLDYLQYLGVGAVWLSPIYPSPMADFGYDVSNYVDIEPVFGTMADFDNLLKAIHDRDMFLIMDFIPNHTSDLHPWFEESRKGGEDNPYSDYYRWSPGKLLENGTRTVPSNWLTHFGYSAWEWDETRQAYYLHQFVKGQPDLNYRNPEVRREMEAVIQFWLDKGVDGLRVDAISTLFEVEDEFTDEPLNPVAGNEWFQHGYLSHIYTLNQPEIHDVTRQWRNLMDKHDSKTGKHTFMVMELYDDTYIESLKYYHSGADMPFNFNLVYMDKACGGSCVHRLVHEWLDRVPEGHWSSQVLSNHDNHRVTTRKGAEYATALNMLLLTLPGSPTTYYGEELALRDIEVSYEDTVDPWGINMGPELYAKFTRDPARAPMQWCACKNAGFSSADKTWLPVHPDYKERNVENQKMDPKSPLEIYRQLATLRRATAFRNHDITYNTINDNVFSFIRRDTDDQQYLIAINFGDKSSTDNYHVDVSGSVITSGTVKINTGDVDPGLETGSDVDLGNLTLKPGDGVVIHLHIDGDAKVEL